MADKDPLDDLIDSTGSSLFDWVLKISLFIGAIFQLVCIFAVILLPSRTPDDDAGEAEEMDGKNERTSPEGVKTSSTSDQHRSTAGRAAKRHEKKKKR